MKPKIYIDGKEGTTGLKIFSRLEGRDDIELLLIDEAKRKDAAERKKLMNAADVVFFCLPDAAAVEAVSLVENPATAIIDTSTAHRVAPGWEYGFPELAGRRERIRASKRIANPGCHASGFVSLVEPLVHCGLLRADAALSCFSLTGYSGGGKKMIAEYEDPARNPLLEAPRQYGLTQKHKHLAEMAAISGLSIAPAFAPVVAPFYRQLEVQVFLFLADLNISPDDVRYCYRKYYAEGLVRVADGDGEGGFLSAGAFSGRDDMEVAVFGNDDRILLVSRFDNLGKGASGAAIQNMNILLGVDERAGLSL